MPALFEKWGISFQYPENWNPEEEDTPAGHRSVTLYSPGGAFWSVAVHSQPIDPEELAVVAVDAMRQEYEQLESESTRETIADHELFGFDLNFYCLDLTNTARVRCLSVDQRTFSIFCQAEDREFGRLGVVFQAITTSLLSELKRMNYWDQ